jgi:hypothetical protein
MWTRIRSGTVHFTRDRASSIANNGSSSSNNNYNNTNNSSTPGTGADDMMIDLRGCTVEVAVYYTKRHGPLAGRVPTGAGRCQQQRQRGWTWIELQQQ